MAKICPECQAQYDDDVQQCAKDGEELVDMPAELQKNPQLLEVVSASPADRTSMIDLEALEAKRKARPRPGGDGGGGEGGDGGDSEKTPPPDSPMEVDGDRTGTLHKESKRKKKDPTVVAEEPEVGGDGDDADNSDIPPDRRVSDEPTNRDMSRGMSRVEKTSRTKTGQTKTGTKAGTKAGQAVEGTAVKTRQTQMKPAAPKRALSPVQASFLVVLALSALIGGIIFVARATAVLTVTTVPPGASVVLDGEPLGLSPVQKRVRTGSHIVELTLDGFEPFKEVVEVPVEGLPFLQPLQKKPPPPPPPPTAAQIADELVKAAQGLFTSGDLELSLKKVDDALKLIPAHAAGLKLKPEIESAIAKRDAAAQAAALAGDRAARLARARQLAQEGRALYERGSMGPAKEKLYASLKLDSDNPEPHRTLGRIFNREDQVDKVRYHLQRYLDLGGADGDFKVREWLKTHPK